MNNSFNEKIIVERKRLLETLQKISGPTLTKTTFPVFSMTLVELIPGKLKLSTTDLELTVISEISVEHSLKKGICVPFKKFLAIIKEFSEKEVQLWIQENILWISCEKCELKLNGIPEEEFPKLPVLKNRPVVKINSWELKRMIDLTSFSVLTQTPGHFLNGVLLEIEEEEIRMVSTDGKRLSLATKKLSPHQAGLNQKLSLLLPYKTVLELNKILSFEEEVFLILGKTQIGFEISSFQFISQLLEGEFPQYTHYILEKSQNRLKVDRLSFLSALRRANILTTPDYQGIKLELTKNKLILSKVTPQTGEYKEELEVDYNGKPLILGFNPNYLIDVLKVLEEEEVLIDVYDEEKPLILRTEDYIYLALPMKLV